MTCKIIDHAQLRNQTCVFKDRTHAGTILADELRPHMGPVMRLLALAAGGIPVGHAVSERIGIALEVAVVRKIQIPWDTEAGFGAVSWDGSVVLNDALGRDLGLTASQIDNCVYRTRQIVSERIQRFAKGKPPEILDQTIVLVDDGLASGYTMMAAVESVRKGKPRRIIVAVPTGSRGAVQLVSTKVDLLICLNIRAGPVFAVADAYEEWHDLTDEEVVRYLQE